MPNCCLWHRSLCAPRQYSQNACSVLPQIFFFTSPDANATSQASPIYESMMEKRNRIPRVRAQANYLIRDTAKVTGNCLNLLHILR